MPIVAAFAGFAAAVSSGSCSRGLLSVLALLVEVLS